MSRKTIALIVEIIPLLSAALSFLLIHSAYDSALVRLGTAVTMLLAFWGFLFFFLGRRLEKEDRLVRVFGVLDLLSTVYVAGIYILAIFSFGL